MTDDDQTLVLRAKDDDVTAYEELYRRHVGRIFALCRRLTKDHDTAEDLTQDAFVQAWRKLGDFRGDSAFGSWLYRIAANIALSHLRSQKHFTQSLEDDDLPAHRETTGLQIGLEQAIANLPDGARTVFVLFAIEGHTHDEIAGLLGIAQGSSKAQLHRARTLLKAALLADDSNQTPEDGVQ
ncbi:MAG: RNA polymerase sigma factor [Proteobacteria bacterium]|jgi:RNA polymerase sigma-70 factor (ECF subfamily)|nr:RNA polymerase sigma factor [Pseudomonadota bacterium]MDA1301922.1 RNA polymerase sigma factor [Pseudomonadota bacterium]